MSANIRLAIEVSQYMRRVMRILFRNGAGLDIDSVAYLLTGEDDGTGVVDRFAPDSEEWDWANSVLMTLRTLYGILENAEGEIE